MKIISDVYFYLQLKDNSGIKYIMYVLSLLAWLSFQNTVRGFSAPILDFDIFKSTWIIGAKLP